MHGGGEDPASWTQQTRACEHGSWPDHGVWTRHINHHIHIWQLNEKETHFEAHIDFYDNISLAEFDKILHTIEEILFHKFDINHVNIQPEYGKCDDKNLVVQD